MAPPLSLLASTLGPVVWTAAGTLAVVVLLVVMLRSRRGPADAPAAPWTPAPSPDTQALGPSAPTLTAEAPAQPTYVHDNVDADEPLLPRIPIESTEWKEGEDLEVDGERPARPLRSIEALIDALRSGDPHLCHVAVEELGRHGATAIPALEAAVRGDDADLAVDAARALALIRGETD